MKEKISIFLLCSLGTVAFSQPTNVKKYADSLQFVLQQTTNDTIKMTTLHHLADYYINNNRDSTLLFAEQSMVISKKINQPLWVARSLLQKIYVMAQLGNLPSAFRLANKAMAIVQDAKNEKNVYIEQTHEFVADAHKYRLDALFGALHQFGNLYSIAGNKEKAINYYKEEIHISELLKSKSGLVTSNMNIGSIYLGLNKLDSAQLYLKRALDNSNLSGFKTYQGLILGDIGTVFFRRKQFDSARQYYAKALSMSKEQNNASGELRANISFAKLYEGLHWADSLMYYAKIAQGLATNLKVADQIEASTVLLSSAYRLKGNIDSAFAYLTISKTLGDSLRMDRNEKLTQFQNINFEEQMRLEKVEQENVAYKNKIRTAGLSGGLGVLTLLAFVFYRNTRQKQKANIVLQNQKQQIENTLNELKATQAQLIQSEKMASLGELTAGIAHEIQNPLNFVNNFSETNTELMEELLTEINAGKKEEAVAIAKDIINNELKITHHGKRADAIVKGMLQHSRGSSGKKEPTDINALADEYLRLAFHGLRAKDKDFNATIQTHFDESLGKIDIIPQDIGRVLLNLFNNAFYAVHEKRKNFVDEYNPTVFVTIRKLNDKIEICVKDNGNGIPQKNIDKIFQPFFTSKPTGEGTGLGLSLSYDIVKAQGGELKVNSIENEGAEFTIVLPV